MTRREALLHHLANLLVGGTGAVYAWMLYVAKPEDPFAVVNHPWQPEAHAAHILVAPLLLFAVGYSWQGHVWIRLAHGFRPRRRTGTVLVALVAPMVVSGYALQVSVAELARSAWLWIHLVSSGLWIVGYCVHLAMPRPQPNLEELAAD